MSSIGIREGREEWMSGDEVKSIEELLVGKEGGKEGKIE